MEDIKEFLYTFLNNYNRYKLKIFRLKKYGGNISFTEFLTNPMKTSILLVTLLFVFVFSKYKNLKVLDANNFNETLNNEYTLLYLTVDHPDCKECVQFGKLLDEIAEKKELSHVPFAVLDCYKKENEKVCADLMITYLPSIKLLKKNKNYREFIGIPMLTKIQKFIQKNAKHVTVVLNSQEEIDNFVKENKGKSIIGYFTNKDDEEHRAFIQLLETDPLFSFHPAAEVFNTELSAKVDGAPAIQLFRKGDTPVHISGAALANIRPWLSGFGFKIFDEVNEKSTLRYSYAKLPLAVAYLKTKDPKYMSLFEDVAKEMIGRFSWGHSKIRKEDEEALKALNFDINSETPKIIVFRADKDPSQNYSPYVYRGELEKSLLVTWAQGILDGKVEPEKAPVPDEIPATHDEL